MVMPSKEMVVCWLLIWVPIVAVVLVMWSHV